ncbi:hypothetical protein [Emticicia sp. 21SJ11W-3]|uniref:hypothetical protein n=1 Tax=Emticicia sp. 21SJ11W-3 TaxID=2916755 RepID=UPI0020A1DEC1|nr:hypothetical protein [Emticicia sp. 21SJ11W-3]UTA69014.1 hypothetical protein MB380_04220 [Emticicia sp. 21SJ11W-3]
MPDIESPVITIINRHYPPNPGITGESAWDMAKYLIEKYEAEIHIVYIDRTYDGGGQVRQPIGILHPVKTIYEGKNGLLKLISGTLDGLFLVLKARKMKRGRIVVMTSPPLLPFWASLFLKNWVLWSMDLFPEGFAAAGTVSPSNFLYRFILKKTYQVAPQHLIALGPNQAAFVRDSYKQAIPTTILPCGVLVHQQNDPAIPDWKKDDSKIYFGYCGNLGQAHSDEFLLKFIDNLDSQKHQLILAVYGEKADKVLTYAQGRAGITILKSVPRSQLHFIDVHLVSLLPQWTHIAVPSKAVSSICAGAGMLFCGSKDADTWALLNNASWLIEENNEINAQIKSFLALLTIDEVQLKRNNAQALFSKLQTMVVDAYDEVKRLGCVSAID